MMISNERAQLEQRKMRLRTAMHERDQLTVEIIQLQSEIKALRAMILRNEIANRQAEVQQAVVGITDAIRSVLRIQNRAMSAAEVKGALDLIGYDFKEIVNPSSVVHNTLKRMAGTGELGYDSRNKTYLVPPPGFVPMNVPADRFRRK